MTGRKSKGLFFLVADTAPEQIEEIQTPVEEQAELPKAEGQDTEGQSATVSEPEGTGSESDDFNLEEFDSYKEAMAQRKAPAEPEAAAPTTQLPGTPLAEVQEQAKRGRAYAYQAQIDGDAESFLRLAEQLALSDDDKRALFAWHQRGINTLHSSYEDWNAHVTNQQYREALPEDVGKKYFQSVYDDHGTGIKGVLAHGDAEGYARANAEWQAKVNNQEYFTAAEYKKLGREALQKGIAVGEGRQTLSSSKQSVQGNAASAGGRMTLDQIEAEPMQDWLSRPKEQRERLLEEAHRQAAR